MVCGIGASLRDGYGAKWGEKDGGGGTAERKVVGLKSEERPMLSFPI